VVKVTSFHNSARKPKLKVVTVPITRTASTTSSSLFFSSAYD
jgi:hypothetical protein